MSLIDEYFKGWNQGQASYDALIQGRQAQAANRIKLDGAQMQLENDAILREARLNQALEELRNSASQHEQQRRFRTGLDGLTYQGEQARLGAETWKNLNNITAERESADIAGATWGDRFRTAQTQAATGTVDAQTANTNAQTLGVFSRAKNDAVQNGEDLIRRRAGLQVTRGYTQEATGQINDNAQQVAAGQGLADASRAARASQVQDTIDSLTREAMRAGKISAQDYQQYLYGIMENSQESNARREAAALKLQQIQQPQSGQVDTMKMQMAVTAPDRVLEQAGLKVLDADPKTGLYPVSDGRGGYRMITHAQMQYQAAILLGIDPKNFQTAANAGEAAIVKAATGDTTLAGIIGAPQTGYYIAPPNTPTPEQQAQTVAINKTIMQATGWMPSVQSPSRWQNPQTGEPVPEADVLAVQQAVKEKLGIQ